MAVLPVLNAGSPLNADDGVWATWPTGTDLVVQSYALDDTPSLFLTMDTLSWELEWRTNLIGDDDIGVEIRIMNGATVLAAADSGGTFQVAKPLNATHTTAGAVVGPTAFTYVNTTASKAQWDAAQVELRQRFSQNMGGDGIRIEVDYVDITGTYTADNAPPDRPTITAPLDNSLFGGDSVSLQATVTDPIEGYDTYAIWELWDDEDFRYIDGVDSPGTTPGGLTNDGSWLWMADIGDHRVRKITSLGTTIDSFLAPANLVGGITWDGTSLWISCTDDVIYNVSEFGNVASQFAAPASNPTGLAWDGTNLWLADSGTDLIYKLTTTGTVLDTIPSPDPSPQGMTWDDGSLWVVGDGNGYFYKLRPTDGYILQRKSTPLPTGNRGIVRRDASFFYTNSTSSFLYEYARATLIEEIPQNTTPVTSGTTHTTTWDSTGVTSGTGTGAGYNLRAYAIDANGARSEYSGEVEAYDESVELTITHSQIHYISGSTTGSASTSATASAVTYEYWDGSAWVSTLTWFNQSTTTWQEPFASGGLTIQIAVENSIGGVSSLSDPASFTVSPFARPNTPVITAPADLSTISGTTSLEATVTDPASDSVRAVWELWTNPTETSPILDYVRNDRSGTLGVGGFTHVGSKRWNTTAIGTSANFWSSDPATGELLSLKTPTSQEWGDIASDGEFFYGAVIEEDDVYKVTESGGYVTDFYMGSNTHPEGVIHDGTNIWVSMSTQTGPTTYGSPRIEKRDPSDGSLLQTISTPKRMSALGWDGTHIWGIPADEDKEIYQYNPVTGDLVDTHTLPHFGGPVGVDWFDGYLWLQAAGESVLKIDFDLIGASGPPAAALVEDIAENGTLVSSGSTHITNFDTSALAEGDYQLRVWAVNSNGLQSQEYDSVDVTIQAGAPNTPVIVDPGNLDVTGGTSTFKAIYSDPENDFGHVIWELRKDKQEGDVIWHSPYELTEDIYDIDIDMNEGVLWTVDWGTDTIYKVDLNDGTVLDSFAAPAGLPRGIVHDGTSLWVSDSGTDLIYEIDPSTGSTLGSFSPPALNPYGMTHDGTYLWVVVSGGTIYRVDPSTGTSTLSWVGDSSSIYGITYDGTHIIVVKNSTQLHYFDATDGSFVRSFQPAKRDFGSGIAWDGTHLRAGDENWYKNKGSYVKFSTGLVTFGDGTETRIIEEVPENTTNVASGEVHYTTWTSIRSGLPSGTYQLRAYGVDSNGNRSSSYDEIDITTAEPPNSPVISSPASGASVSGYQQIQASVSDPLGERVYAEWEAWSFGRGDRVRQFNWANNEGGFAHDGTNLWVVSQVTDGIYKVNPTTGGVSTSFATPTTGIYQSLAHDGTDLWTADTAGTTGLIYRVSTVDGSVLQSFASPGTEANVMGLAHDGTSLWALSDSPDQNLYRLDPSDGSILDTFSHSVISPQGLVWDGTNFWAGNYRFSSTHEFYKLDTSGNKLETIEVTAEFQISNATGIGYHDGFFWTFEDSNFSSQRYIHQIVLTGTAALVQDIPTDTDPVNSGSTHTTTWDTTGLTPGTYSLRAWTRNFPYGIRSEGYDFHPVTVGAYAGDPLLLVDDSKHHHKSDFPVVTEVELDVDVTVNDSMHAHAADEVAISAPVLVGSSTHSHAAESMGMLAATVSGPSSAAPSNDLELTLHHSGYVGPGDDIDGWTLARDNGDFWDDASQQWVAP